MGTGENLMGDFKLEGIGLCKNGDMEATLVLTIPPAFRGGQPEQHHIPEESVLELAEWLNAYIHECQNRKRAFLYWRVLP